LEAQIQRLTAPSFQAVIELLDMQLDSYFQTPAHEPMLTNPDEVQNAIRGLKVGKAPGQNGIPKRSLKHHPMREVILLVQIFKAILRIHHFPPPWKNA
jgi:hypothetical protein